MKIVNGTIILSHAEVKGYDWGIPFTKLFPMARFKNGFWFLPAEPEIGKAIFEITGIELSLYPTPIKEIDPDVFKTKPYPHQIKALMKCDGRNNFAYFLEPGLGKTKTLIDDVTILHENENLNSVLVICPKSVMSTWVREIQKHSKYAHVSFVSAWPERPPITPGLSWYIVNPDALVSSTAMVDCENFIELSKRPMVTIDESTMIANPKAQRTKKIYTLGAKAKYRRILTGDPIANAPVDLYSQLKWLEPKCLSAKSLYQFKNRYCIMGGFKGKEILGYHRTDELRSVMDSVGVRERTVDVIELPPQTWMEPIRVSPDKTTLEIYERIVEEEILTLFDDPETKVTSSLVITKMGRLLQTCGGTVKTDDGMTHEIGNEKLKALKEMLSDWGNTQVLIWCHYTAEIAMLFKELSKKWEVGIYAGHMGTILRSQVEVEFERGQLQILLLQDDTAHLGLTLNAASHAIFYSNHLRPMVRSQAERRNWRIGQTKPVFYYDILMDGLIDCKVYKTLRDKRNLNELITDGMSRETMRDFCYE